MTTRAFLRVISGVLAAALVVSCGPEQTSEDEPECPENYDCVPCPEGYTCHPTDDNGGDSEEDDGDSDENSDVDDSNEAQNDSGDDQCPELPDPPGDDVVDLAEEGLEEGDEIDPYLDQHLQEGTRVRIPEGTYQWNGGGFDGDLSDRSVVGDGDVVFDTGGGHTFSPTFNADGAFELRNVTVQGVASGEDGKMRVYPTSDDAKIVMRNFNQPDGAEDGERSGMYVPRDARGQARFVDCHVEGFSDNGLYASSPGYEDGGGGAEIHVVRGLYKDNNISGVRIGSTNSSVDGTVIVQGEPSPTTSDGARNQRGLRIRAAGDDISVDNVDIIQRQGANNAVAYKLDVPGGSGHIEDVRIENDIDNRAIDVPEEAGEWTGNDIHITGDGSHETRNIDIDEICRGAGCDSPRDTARQRCPE